MMNAAVLVRQLRNEPADFHRIIEIENLSFNKYDAYSLEDFQRWYAYDPQFCLVAEIDGCIVGDMLCRVLRRKLDLASCAIHPDYRRGGVGSALLKEMETRAKQAGVTLIELQVRKTNSSGLAFWRKMGFIESGSLPAFYPDGEDGIRMAKKI